MRWKLLMLAALVSVGCGPKRIVFVEVWPNQGRCVSKESVTVIAELVTGQREVYRCVDPATFKVTFTDPASRDAAPTQPDWQAEAECWFRVAYSREWSSAWLHGALGPIDGPAYIPCRREP